MEASHKTHRPHIKVGKDEEEEEEEFGIWLWTESWDWRTPTAGELPVLGGCKQQTYRCIILSYRCVQPGLKLTIIDHVVVDRAR